MNFCNELKMKRQIFTGTNSPRDYRIETIQFHIDAFRKTLLDYVSEGCTCDFVAPRCVTFEGLTFDLNLKFIYDYLDCNGVEYIVNNRHDCDILIVCSENWM